MQNLIFQYVRNERMEKVGVVAAICRDDIVYVSWSKCHTYLDDFDKNMALPLAIGRAFLLAEEHQSGRRQVTTRPPDIVIPILQRVAERAKRWFKTDTVISWSDDKPSPADLTRTEAAIVAVRIEQLPEATTSERAN